MSKHINIPPEEQVALMRAMLRIRFAEERLARDFKAGELPGPVHLYIGQEAIAVGLCAHLGDRDAITSTHRGHGHFLAKGGDAFEMFAEIRGRRSGICGGMGGSMHVADVSKGILGANGIVGGGIAIAAGAALAAQLDGKNRVAVAFFGDGASAQGVFSETLNISALWQLPLIFVCENNGFSEFSPSDTVLAGAISDRAAPFGIPALTPDGNDVTAVWQAAHEAVARARDGDGPTLIEARTYRFHGHVEGEGAFLKTPYRTEEEVEERRAADPLTLFRASLLGRGILETDALDALAAQVEAEINAAGDRSLGEAWPDPSDLNPLELS